MAKYILLILSILQSGCSSQMTYDGVIFVVNNCHERIFVTGKNYTGSIVSQDFNDPKHISLPPSGRGIIATFSLADFDQDFSGHFTGNNGDFVLHISNGNQAKEFKGKHVYNLINNVTNAENLKVNLLVYEINTTSICPH